MNPLKIKNNQLIYQSSATNERYLDSAYVFLSLFIIFSASLALFFNQHFFYFRGYPYFELNLITYVLFIAFIRFIIKHLLNNHTWEPKITDFLITFVTMVLIGYSTTAVQLTPFRVIDNVLGGYEQLPLIQAMQWTQQHPSFRKLLVFTYNLLNNTLIYGPIICIMMGYRHAVHHYCRFMLLSTAIGFSIYYFFPSNGPASYYTNEFFSSIQHANHIKFWLIHHGKTPLSPDGGLIALPSFHVIWAWACCRLFFQAPKAIYYSVFIYFVLTITSCFCLGWHYSIDILGSLLIIAVSETLLSYIKE